LNRRSPSAARPPRREPRTYPFFQLPADPTPTAGAIPLLRTEYRYLGYREADLLPPYAEYADPDALADSAALPGPSSPAWRRPSNGYTSTTRPDSSRPGYQNETGWTVRASGVVCRQLPEPTALCPGEMFGWWFPRAQLRVGALQALAPTPHQSSNPVGEPPLQRRELTLRQVPTWTTGPNVDEYVARFVIPLAIRFLDPRASGSPSAARAPP